MMAIGFLGYVLPMGQMSLWGATVITNLLSAIPVFGQDLVELIWKLKKAFYKKLNLYYAYLEQSKSKLKKFIYLKTYLPWYANFPKRALEWAKITLNSKLTLFKKETQNEFPVIGEINWKKVRKEKPLTDLDIKFLLSIPFAFLAKLAGIIDGDGYISVISSDKVRGYANISLKIGLIEKDLPLLNFIKDTLCLGRIAGPYNKKGQPFYYLIFNKTELQQVLFPLFIYHNIFFLTETRRAQFEKALFFMESGKSKISDLPEILPSSTYLTFLPQNAQGYIELKFFPAWVVGFTIAEGSFVVKKNSVCSFQLRQRSHPELFLAFKLLFNTTRKITVDSQKGVNYEQFSVSSKLDIQTVINFFPSQITLVY